MLYIIYMINAEKIHNIIRIAGMVTGLVILQQLVAMSLFGLEFSWSFVPELAIVNFGIVIGWLYFKRQDNKITQFALGIAAFCAAFCFAIWLRAVLIYLGVFRFVAQPVITFIERQLAFIITFIATPQFIPTLFAALILLLLLPKARELFGRGISNGSFEGF